VTLGLLLAAIDGEAIRRDRTRPDPGTLSEPLFHIGTAGVRQPAEAFEAAELDRPQRDCLIPGLTLPVAVRALCNVSPTPATVAAQTLRPATLAQGMAELVAKGNICAKLSVASGAVPSSAPPGMTSSLSWSSCWPTFA
jgi:hypothetical protein